MAIWKDLQGNLYDDMNGAALSLQSWKQGMTKLTVAEARAAQYPAPTLAQLVQAAKSALLLTDITALRCIKAGVVFPVNWLSYVAALRKIVNGTDTISTVLPTQPAYPPGT